MRNTAYHSISASVPQNIQGKLKKPRPLRPSLSTTVIVLFVLMCFGVVLFVCCDYIASTNALITEELAIFYLRLVNGVRTRSYEMNTRAVLLRLVSFGTINDTLLAGEFPEVVSFSAYLSNVSQYLSIFDPLDRSLLRPNSSALGLYPQLLRRTLPLGAVSGDLF